jgi:hypothetical protein
VRNLPLPSTRVTSLGARSSGTPPQGASSSSKPVEDDDLQQVASKVSRLHLAKTKLSGSARRKLKKARESQGSTGGAQQLGCTASSKPRENLTRMPKKTPGLRAVPQSERPTIPKDPGTLPGSGTYKEASRGQC